MAATIEVNATLGIREKADRLANILGVGSPLCVVNKDTKTAQGDPNDPYQIIAATAGTDLNCIFIRNINNLSWFEMYPIFSGATPPTTVLKVRAFGFVRDLDRSVLGGGARRLPPDYDSTNFDESHFGGDNQKPIPAGHFLPLAEDGQTLPGEITFDNTVLVDKDDTSGGAKRFQILTPRSVFCVGYEGILVAVSQAHDAITAGQLIGRFITRP